MNPNTTGDSSYHEERAEEVFPTATEDASTIDRIPAPEPQERIARLLARLPERYQGRPARVAALVLMGAPVEPTHAQALAVLEAVPDLLEALVVDLETQPEPRATAPATAPNPAIVAWQERLDAGGRAELATVLDRLPTAVPIKVPHVTTYALCAGDHALEILEIGESPEAAVRKRFEWALGQFESASEAASIDGPPPHGHLGDWLLERYGQDLRVVKLRIPPAVLEAIDEGAVQLDQEGARVILERVAAMAAPRRAGGVR